MTGGRRAPGALVVLAVAAVAMAFGGDQPLVLAAVAAGAVALFLAAPGRPSRWFLVGGAISGLGVAILNPFVSAEGDLILWRGPDLPVIDLEITLEEVAMGIAMGVRVFAVAVLVGAVLAHIDADRLQAQVARVAPRSALTVALAARLLPTLERDARAISETARLRGLDLSRGSWPARARRGAPLALPLLGSGLERGLDVATRRDHAPGCPSGGTTPPSGPCSRWAAPSWWPPSPPSSLPLRTTRTTRPWTPCSPPGPSSSPPAPHRRSGGAR